jgi:hypothetical protein
MEVIAGSALVIKSGLLVQQGDLGATRGQNVRYRIMQDIAVMALVQSLSPHAGVHLTIRLQQEETFAAIERVGAVGWLELVKPVPAESLLQFGSRIHSA